MNTQTETNRTISQNKALHLLFTHISNYCIETGIDQKAIVSQLDNYSIPTTPQVIKEIWRSIQISVTGKTSTKDLNKKEIDQVYDVFNKFISEVTHEYFAFPNMVDLLRAQEDNEKYK
jgi:hypothetical protein